MATAVLQPGPAQSFASWKDAALHGVAVYNADSPAKFDVDGTPLYLWTSDTTEDELLTKILGVILKAPNTWVVAPQYCCQGCGRQSGFADSVHTALQDGVHSKQFLIEAVRHPRPNSAPQRFVRYCVSVSPFWIVEMLIL